MNNLHPAHLVGALVVTPYAGGPQQTIQFQYNPETMRRQLTPQLRGGETDMYSDQVHYLGAPEETISMQVVLDASEALDGSDPVALQYGILPELAILETLMSPPVGDVVKAQSQLAAGVMEIAPFVVPNVVLVWGRQRTIPVQVTGYSATETLYDTNLNPLHAVIDLTLKVLSWSNVNATDASNKQYLAYQQQLAMLSALAKGV